MQEQDMHYGCNLYSELPFNKDQVIESFITPAPFIHSAVILAELFPSPKSRVS